MVITDSQLPRFQVFLQEKEGSPHKDVGSVHAADPEMALLNARDVFVRRPNCTSLWVVPAGAIFSRTAQELEVHGIGGVSEGITSAEAYCIFSKPGSSGTQTWFGTVEATAPQEALAHAFEIFSGIRKAFAWWVFPASAITKSDRVDVESMFAPALDKDFRMATDFHTLSMMRKIQAENREEQAGARAANKPGEVPS